MGMGAGRAARVEVQPADLRCQSAQCRGAKTIWLASERRGCHRWRRERDRSEKDREAGGGEEKERRYEEKQEGIKGKMCQEKFTQE